MAKTNVDNGLHSATNQGATFSVRRLSHEELWTVSPFLTRTYTQDPLTRWTTGADDGRPGSTQRHVEYCNWFSSYYLSAVGFLDGAEVFGAFEALNPTEPIALVIAFLVPSGNRRLQLEALTAMLMRQRFGHDSATSPMMRSQLGWGPEALTRTCWLNEEVERSRKKMVGDRLHSHICCHRVPTTPLHVLSSILKHYINSSRSRCLPLFTDSWDRDMMSLFKSVGFRIVKEVPCNAEAGKPPSVLALIHANHPCRENVMYRVTGGIGTEGIVVREGSAIKTAQLGRLSTGSLLITTEIVGDRLRYELLQGSGPLSGWVCATVKGTVLCEPVRELLEGQQKFAKRKVSEASTSASTEAPSSPSSCAESSDEASFFSADSSDKDRTCSSYNGSRFRSQLFC